MKKAEKIYLHYFRWDVQDPYCRDVCICKNRNGYWISVERPHSRTELKSDRNNLFRHKVLGEKEITETIWEDIKRKLFVSFYLLLWKSEYIDADVCDGDGWSVEITFSDNSISKYNGQNSYPLC